MISSNPVHESRLPADSGSEIEDTRAIPTEALEGILETLGARESHYSDAIEFLALTGIRWGELKDLRVGSLADLPYPRLSLVSSESDGYERKSTKSRERRFVPLVPRALDLFNRNARGQSADDRVFTSPKGPLFSAPRSQPEAKAVHMAVVSGVRCAQQSDRQYTRLSGMMAA